jgi:hypothetical protein
MKTNEWIQRFNTPIDLEKLDFLELITLVKDAKTIIESQQIEKAQLSRHLKDIEFVDTAGVGDELCPACGRKHRHDPDCWLHNAIKGVNNEN